MYVRIYVTGTANRTFQTDWSTWLCLLHLKC